MVPSGETRGHSTTRFATSAKIFFQIQVPTYERDMLVTKKATRKTSGEWISLFLADLSVYEVKCEELVNEHVRVFTVGN